MTSSLAFLPECLGPMTGAAGTLYQLPESGVRNHAGHLRVVGVRDISGGGKPALGLDLLRREDMAHFGLATLDFARGRLFEALGRAPVSLQFGHGYPARKAIDTTVLSIRDSADLGHGGKGLGDVKLLV